MRFGPVVLALILTITTGACSDESSDSPEALTRIVLQPGSTERGTITEPELQLSIEVIRSRLDKLGVRSPSLEASGKTIIVILPSDQADEALPLLMRAGRLELFDLQGDLVSGVSLDAQGFPRASVRALSPRPHSVVATCAKTVPYCPGVNSIPARTYYYLFKYDPNNRAHPIPELTGADLELNGTRQDFDPRTGEPVVLVKLTSAGAKKFHMLTRRLATRGRVLSSRIDDPELAFQQLAIVLDREIRSAPTIDYNENPDGIPGNKGVQISGIGSLDEARELALVLKTGALPTSFHVASRDEAL